MRHESENFIGKRIFLCSAKITNRAILAGNGSVRDRAFAVEINGVKAYALLADVRPHYRGKSTEPAADFFGSATRESSR